MHVPGSTTPRIDALPLHTSPLQRWPGAARHYRALLPLLPWAVRQLRIDGYDLVVSVHHAFAKAARIAPGTKHLCYCLTPMRYAWDAVDVYLGRGLRRARRRRCSRAAPLRPPHRRPRRVTRVVAISEFVRDAGAALLGPRRVDRVSAGRRRDASAPTAGRPTTST